MKYITGTLLGDLRACATRGSLIAKAADAIESYEKTMAVMGEIPVPRDNDTIMRCMADQFLRLMGLTGAYNDWLANGGGLPASPLPAVNSGNIMVDGQEYVPLEAYREAMAGWKAANRAPAVEQEAVIWRFKQYPYSAWETQDVEPDAAHVFVKEALYATPPAPALDGVREALEKARDQFQFYATEHWNKAAEAVDPDEKASREKKAQTNQDFADMCVAALSSPSEGESAPASIGARGGAETCRRCGHRNLVWCAPSPLWNAVIRGGCINGEPEYEDMVCPNCFMELAEAKGVAEKFRVSAESVHVSLQTATPSGRIWDEDEWLWRPSPIGRGSGLKTRSSLGSSPRAATNPAPLSHDAEGESAMVALEGETLGCDYCNNDGPLIRVKGHEPRCPRCDAEYPDEISTPATTTERGR